MILPPTCGRPFQIDVQSVVDDPIHRASSIDGCAVDPPSTLPPSRSRSHNRRLRSRATIDASAMPFRIERSTAAQSSCHRRFRQAVRDRPVRYRRFADESHRRRCSRELSSQTADNGPAPPKFARHKDGPAIEESAPPKRSTLFYKGQKHSCLPPFRPAPRTMQPRGVAPRRGAGVFTTHARPRPISAHYGAHRSPLSGCPNDRPADPAVRMPVRNLTRWAIACGVARPHSGGSVWASTQRRTVSPSVRCGRDGLLAALHSRALLSIEVPALCRAFLPSEKAATSPPRPPIAWRRYPAFPNVARSHLVHRPALPRTAATLAYAADRRRVALRPRLPSLRSDETPTSQATKSKVAEATKSPPPASHQTTIVVASRLTQSPHANLRLGRRRPRPRSPLRQDPHQTRSTPLDPTGIRPTRPGRPPPELHGPVAKSSSRPTSRHPTPKNSTTGDKERRVAHRSGMPNGCRTSTSWPDFRPLAESVPEYRPRPSAHNR